MGRLPTLQLMTLKMAHYHELLGMITGYERPLAATTLRPARDNCEGCHWPESTTPTRSAPRSTTRPTPRTPRRARGWSAHGQRHAREKTTRGTTGTAPRTSSSPPRDAQRRTIPWVRSRQATARRSPTSTRRPRSAAPRWTRSPKRGWSAVTAPSGRASVRQPANTVDEAVRTGKIDRSLPPRPRRAPVSLADALADISGEPEREAKVDKLIADAAAKADAPYLQRQAGRAEFDEAITRSSLRLVPRASRGSRSPSTRGARTRRAAAATKRARGGRDVAAVVVEHMLNVLPFDALDGHRPRVDRHAVVATVATERGHDRIRVRRLRQVIGRPQLDRLDSPSGCCRDRSARRSASARSAAFSCATTLRPGLRPGSFRSTTANSGGSPSIDAHRVRRPVCDGRHGKAAGTPARAAHHRRTAPASSSTSRRLARSRASAIGAVMGLEDRERGW